MMTKEVNGWTKDKIRNLLVKSDVAVERAILRVYDKQTRSEQIRQATTEYNGVGFTGFDAKMFCSFAQWLTRRPGNHLTPKQLAYARKLDRRGNSRIGKYAGQLLKIMEEDLATQ